jgi:hypothetical protein
MDLDRVDLTHDWKLFGIVAVVLVVFYGAIMYILSDSDTDRKTRLRKID